MKQFLTYGVFDYQCMKQAGDLSDNDINSDIRQSYVNTKLMKIYQMLDGLNDPFYNRVATGSPFSPVADHAIIDQDVLESVNASTHQLTIVSGSLTVGSLISVYTYNVTTATTINKFVAVITVVSGGGTVATYSIITGTEASATISSTHVGAVSVIKSLTATTLSVSGIYFQKIVRLSDGNYTPVPNAKIRVFDKKEDSQLFFNHDKDQLSTKRVWWYQSGDTIYLSLGSAANAIGTITGEYRGKPALYTDSTIDVTIDLPPEFSQMLIDEVVASYLVDRGKVVPEDVNGRMANYAKAYESAAASRAKAMEIANK